MPVYAAFLRGINVGGKNILPMKDLAAMFTKAGCSHVVTYIQSGNVIFQADKSLAAEIPAEMEGVILKVKKLEVPVIVRSGSELKKIVERNPFASTKVDPKLLHVGFLADKPDAALVKSLDPNRSPPDEFQVIGGEIFFKLPNGAGKSKLTTQYFDSRLKTTVTMRNWNTVQKLLEMCDAVA